MGGSSSDVDNESFDDDVVKDMASNDKDDGLKELFTG